MHWINQTFSSGDQSPRTLRRFGFRFGAVVLAAALWCGWRHQVTGWAMAAVAAGSIIAAEFRPRLLRFPHRGWLVVALVLRRVIPPVLITIVFYLLVMPIGFVQQLLRRRLIDLCFITGATSYWKPRQNSGLTRGAYERQF